MLALPVVRRSRHANWGYEFSPENEWRLIPNEFQFKVLVQARDYLEEGHPLRQVAQWMTVVADRNIDYKTLMNLMRDRYPLNEALELTEDERRQYLAPSFDYWGLAPKSKAKNFSGWRNKEKEEVQKNLQSEAEDS